MEKNSHGKGGYLPLANGLIHNAIGKKTQLLVAEFVPVAFASYDLLGQHDQEKILLINGQATEPR